MGTGRSNSSDERGLRATALVAVVLMLAAAVAVLAPSTASAQISVGEPDGTALTPSGSVKVTTDGMVVDSLDIDGSIIIDANNVKVVRTRVTYGGYHAIRIMPGRSGAVIEDVDIQCTYAGGKGVIAGGYVARRVDVTGCKKPFVYSDDGAIVEDSLWNGKPVGTQTQPNPTPAPEGPPPTEPAPTTAPPTTAPPTTAPPTTPAPTTPPDPLPTPAPEGTLQWSTTIDRTSPQALADATVGGAMAVFLAGGGDNIDHVEWWVDELRYRDDDLFAPYDLVANSDGRSGLFDTTSLDDGSHEVRAELFIGDRVTSVDARFTVANDGSDPTPEPTPIEPNPVPPTPIEPNPVPPTPPPSPGMPSRSSIVADAGLSDPGALKPSSTVVVDTAGSTVKNLDVAGSVVVNADNVTVRNVRVTGSSSTALIKIASGVKNTTIEDCVVSVTSGGANGGIGYLGTGTTVRRCEITGYADGIKAESDGLYEYNYIHMWKPVGSSKHLDGIQGSGDSDYTIRRNVIDAPISAGGNSAIFVQAWWGSGNAHVRNVVVDQNYVSGGNYVVYLEGGKDKDGTDPKSWVHDYRLTDNVFGTSGYRYGLLRVANCAETTVTGNVDTGGAVVKAC
jgi:hypothetical protein